MTPNGDFCSLSPVNEIKVLKIELVNLEKVGVYSSNRSERSGMYGRNWST